MSCEVVVRRLLGFVILGACAVTQAAGHDWRDGHESRREYGGEQRWDNRRGPERVYVAPDRWISGLPPRHWVTTHRGSRYWFANGYWYTPYAGGYMVVRPPLGIVITDLPVFASVVTFGAVTYYLANDVYYRRVPEGYEVVDRPDGAPPVAAQSLPERQYVYPKLGQSADKQAADEYDCHRWAVQQSGYDPTLALQSSAPVAGVVSPAGSLENYQRATQACLEGRGYTVK